MNEQENIKINLAKLFPAAARRVEILNALKNSWPQVVGPMLAKNSCPHNLGVNELCIFVRDKRTGDFLRKTKGNILRALSSRWNYEPDGDFVLKISERPPTKITRKRAKKNISASITVSEDDVKKFMAGAPESLPEDINRAISHLKAFLEKRFP